MTFGELFTTAINSFIAGIRNGFWKTFGAKEQESDKKADKRRHFPKVSIVWRTVYFQTNCKTTMDNLIKYAEVKNKLCGAKYFIEGDTLKLTFTDRADAENCYYLWNPTKSN